jgi:LacI family transcriptional regulator
MTMRDRASIKDVAATAGVSVTTVSRVINDVATVEPELRARVEAAVTALNYVPNTVARSLKTGAGNTIGVVVDSIDDVFFSSVVSAIEQRAIAFGLGVVVCSTGFDAKREREQILRLASQHVRGIILAPVGDDHDFLEAHRSSTPVVTVDRSVPGFDSVTVDDYAAARDGVERLIALRRRVAYEDALASRGLALDPVLVPEVPFESRAARGAVHGVLALDNPPTALFLSNARHASVVISALHDLGRTEIATLAFGDFALANAVLPSVSCIDQDPYAMGALAFERLAQRFDSPDLPVVDQVIPTGFIARTSHTLRPCASIATKSTSPEQA